MEITQPLETVIINPTVPVENGIEYTWFRKRVLAYLCDLWFYTLIIPLFVSIYYYFKEWQTLWYKVLWLSVKNEQSLKPWRRKLLWRFLAKWYWLILLVFIVMTSLALIFWPESLQERSLYNWLNIISYIWAFFTLIYRIPIPFNLKNKWFHDMIAKTEVHKIWEVKRHRLIVWIILLIIWPILLKPLLDWLN